jgi:hypothetical protein
MRGSRVFELVTSASLGVILANRTIFWRLSKTVLKLGLGHRDLSWNLLKHISHGRASGDS